MVFIEMLIERHENLGSLCVLVLRNVKILELICHCAVKFCHDRLRNLRNL